MTSSYDKFAATVLLPENAIDQVTAVALRKWLQRGNFMRFAEPRQKLEAVLAQLGRGYDPSGLAALRMWGQTGDRPTVWVAAADPVYLEPRLDHLCLHALEDEMMPPGELGVLFDFLQDKLAGQERYGFARIGAYGYVRAAAPMATSSLPAAVIDGDLPNDYLPVDQSGSYHALRGEVEMALHEHPVNQQRQAAGLPPVNSLWLWGGGFAPEQETLPQPPLFANEPTLKGYWLSKTGVAADWPGSIEACLAASVAGFVAEPATGDADWIDRCLSELQVALRSGRLSKVTLLLGNRSVLTLARAHGWMLWRRNRQLFGQQP